MKLSEAKHLADTLRAGRRGQSLWSAHIAEERGYPRIVFSGGQKGEHSLDVGVSSRERIIAHWLGYIESNGFVVPEIGDRVIFPAASAPGGERLGKVIGITGSRALMTYRFKHGGEGAPRWVSLWELRVHMRRAHARNSAIDEALSARVKSLVHGRA